MTTLKVSKILLLVLGLIVAGGLWVLAFSQSRNPDKPNTSEKTSRAVEAATPPRSDKAANDMRSEETGLRTELKEALRTKPAQEVETVRSLGSLASPPGADYGKDTLVRPPR